MVPGGDSHQFVQPQSARRWRRSSLPCGCPAPATRAKLGSMEAEVSKMAVAHEGLERRVVGALEQILHRVNEMERKMPRGRVGM